MLDNDTCESLDVDQLKTPILIVREYRSDGNTLYAISNIVDVRSEPECDNPAVTTFSTGLDNHAFERMIIDDCKLHRSRPHVLFNLTQYEIVGRPCSEPTARVIRAHCQARPCWPDLCRWDYLDTHLEARR